MGLDRAVGQQVVPGSGWGVQAAVDHGCAG